MAVPMEELNPNISSVKDDSDLAAFEAKVKDKLYELQIKRSILSETRSKLQEELLEKYNLERSLEEGKRELEEIKIQLDVAVQAVRRGELERANNREALARQSVQLETTINDRNILQEQVRKMQMENGELKSQLEQFEEKMRSHVHSQENCKIKENQWRSYVDTLQSEVKSFEEAHDRLKEMMCNALIVTKKILNQMIHEKNMMTETLAEKFDLRNQVICLSSEVEKLKLETKNENQEVNICDKLHLQEWEKIQQDMEVRLKESETEIENLENSLKTALATIAELQKSADAKDERIKILEEKLNEIRSKTENVVEKSSQTDLSAEPNVDTIPKNVLQ